MVALVVALATSASLRAVAYRWPWGSPQGRWAAGPVGCFSYGPWGQHRHGFGHWGGPWAPAPVAPVAPAPAPPVAPAPAAPGSPAPSPAPPPQ